MDKCGFDPKTFLLTPAEGLALFECGRGEALFSQGEPAGALFFLLGGKVKITVLSPGGKEAVVSILGPGDFLGESCLTEQAVRMATASALSACSAVRIEKDHGVRLLRDEPAFARFFVSYLLGRASRIEEDLIDHLFNTSEKRLARALLLLGSAEGETGAALKISQETLAEMVGTTRSRVNYFMNRFRARGFIDYTDGLEVRSSLLNVILHD